jgi:nucleotide-binding universal stress UspA family protein
MTNILLPTDFSPASRDAYSYALGLAPYLGARITLLHVANEPVPAWSSARAPMGETGYASEEVKAEFEALRSLPLSDNVAVETQVSHGMAASQIVTVSREMQADLIIMGCQGMHQTRARLFGRETTQVIQQAMCPVLVIPEGVNFYPFQHMSYASGAALYGETEEQETLQELLGLAEAFQAKVSCAHLQPRPNQWYRMEFRYLESRVRRKLTAHRLGVYHFPEENLIQGMHKFMQETQVDLLALCMAHQTFFDWLFEVSFGRQLAAHTRVPLLLFRG